MGYIGLVWGSRPGVGSDCITPPGTPDIMPVRRLTGNCHAAVGLLSWCIRAGHPKLVMQQSKVEAHMIVRNLRREKGWSQEDLAQFSGLSVRTVQRIERGKKAGLESLKCLAAVFETDVANLMQEQTMADNGNYKRLGKERDESESIEYVENLKGFHLNWISFLFVVPCLYALNRYVSPDILWVIYPAVGWAFGIALHALVIFGLFGLFNTRWEKRQIEKRNKRLDDSGVGLH